MENLCNENEQNACEPRRTDQLQDAGKPEGAWSLEDKEKFEYEGKATGEVIQRVKKSRE